MKRVLFFIVLITVLLPMKLFGQTYSSLWKQVEAEQERDTPRSAMAIIEKIRKKAEKEKQYGHLIKAELLYISTETSITPDSLKPSVMRLVQKEAKVRNSDPVLAAVYQTILSRIYDRYDEIDPENAYDKRKEYKSLAMSRPELLAQHKASEYEPLLVEGYDSRWFENDLLSVIGYELREYEKMHDYYVKTHLRTAACLTAMEIANEHRWWGKREVKQSEYIKEIDSLITEYGDLKVAGELALSRYEFMERANDVTVEDRVNYINYALNKWGDWPRLNELRNNLKELTQPTFRVDFGKSVSRPLQPRMIEVTQLRNLDQLTMTVTQVDLDASKEYSLYKREVYAQVKKAKIPGTERVINRQFIGLPDYQVVERDTFQLEGLPVGMYLVEFTTSNNNVEPVRFLHYVSDLYLLQQELQENKTRYVVVSATTGQPFKNAKLRFIPTYNRNEKSPVEMACDDKGELVKKTENYSRYDIFAYTPGDQYLPPVDERGSFSYYTGSYDTRIIEHIYTDRAIYRPGQTVHVAVVASKTVDGLKSQARAKERLKVSLKDANWKEVASQEVLTDEYGTATVDFNLPKDGLTGRFSVRTSRGSASFSVEEYKRPTFQVEFPKVDKPYHAGDTVVVTAHARTYAGVPVQGAQVKYKITRRQSFWWRHYGGGADDGAYIKSGEAVTNEEGAFTVEIPIEVPESDSKYPLFYNITTVAEVTDQAGETRNGELSLPIGTRETAFSCDIPEQVERDSLKSITFALRNAAGVPVNGNVSYQFDKGKTMKAQANTPVNISHVSLASGKHHLHAVCGKDTIDTDFTVFTLHDKRPCVETHDWYYITDQVFPRNGAEVHQQLGTSDQNVYVVYTIISEKELLESGSFQLSNENQNRAFKYKEEWGSGLVLNYAWVRDGVLYEHSSSIERPLPDKRLILEWGTFRDRLTPGQQEEWTLRVKQPDGTPAKAQLLAVLYDQSLDAIVKHNWRFDPSISQSLPSTSWNGMSFGSLTGSSEEPYKSLPVKSLSLYHFDESLFHLYRPLMVEYEAMSRGYMMADMAAPMAEEEAADGMRLRKAKAAVANKDNNNEAEETPRSDEAGGEVQMRENFNETAFFMPQITPDDEGNMVLKFTLPESLTTWQFMGMAHDTEMNYGFLRGQAIAKKDVMVQPNLPRFLRAGDEAQIAMKVFNTSEADLSGAAKIELLDPETEAVVFTKQHRFNVPAGQTSIVTFDYTPDSEHPLLICRMTAQGKKFSDGEQHYLPVLPDREQVLNTRVITQHKPGVKEFDINQLFPEGTTDRALTVEYTNNPAWMMIQALPSLAADEDDNAITQAATFYANGLGRYLMNQSPKIKETIEAWNLEQGDETSLNSNLERNEELKSMLLNETPWVMDADFETNQRKQLADYFNEKKINDRLSNAIDKLQNLQLGDGSWSWWKGMNGSLYVTTEVTEMLVRLNALVGHNDETANMLNQSFKFLGKELVKEMEELKKEAKEGAKNLRPSEWAVQTLYAMAIDGRKLSDKAEQAKHYMVDLLAKRTNELTIYGKAIVAVVLAKNGKEKKAADYLQSIREYSVMTEEMGRYYDSPKAYYSWFDYKIPTEVAAVEAIQMLQPADVQTVEEMQRWLLMSKRTQAWDTPINSVNAVYVFMKGNNQLLDDREPARITADGQQLVVEQRNAGLGSEKHRLAGDDIPQQVTIDKTSTGTSWGAIYAQFTQKTTEVEDAATGLTITREIIGGNELHVGDKVKVRITIQATQDFDFVQVSDKRAACLEPIQQLSGYRHGYYCTPKDQVTNYYFDRMAKGKHVVETEYYIDREGTYTTGSCTVQCAYAPEYAGRTHAETLKVVK